MRHDTFDSLLGAVRSTVACVAIASPLGCGGDDDGAAAGTSTTDASTSTTDDTAIGETATSTGASGVDTTDGTSTVADTSTGDEGTDSDSGVDEDPYGPAYAMDGLGNMQVGGPSSGTSNVAVAYRFVAATSAELDAVRVYVVNQDHPGYGGGTGGTLHVALEGEDAGFPDSMELASFEIVGPGDALQTWSFPAPPSLVAGTTYHLVFTNVDPDPIANFVSMNSTWVRDAVAPRQPKWTDEEFGSARKFGDDPWSDATEQQYTPILELEYADGVHQGQGYMEISYGEGEYGIIHGTDQMVRESFTPSDRSRTIAGAHVRVMRDAGEDPLMVTLEDDVGTELGSFEIAAADVPIGALGGTGEDSIWVGGSFAAEQMLMVGQTYRLRLSTGADTTYYTYVIRKGISYDFTSATYFGDGHSEATSDGVTYTSLGRVPDENDLQFYLD